jgi:uncharacterized CHY-type Zn-finger protein
MEMKLSDLAEYEKKLAKVDKKGNILCPECNKELAPNNEYGIIKMCPICKKKERYYNVMVMLDEPSGRRTY